MENLNPSMLKKPTHSDVFLVMESICKVPNVWAFCDKWEKENPKLFNKFMDMCAWFREDETYLKYKKEIKK